MSDIKSAREIAMEKVEKLGEATEEERRSGSMSRKEKSWQSDI